jgi:hypothetical protein
MFMFRVIGWFLYKPSPPLRLNKYKTSDVTIIIPTIDTDEEAMHEAMRSWVLNEPYEMIIVTVGEETQKELQRIADTSVAADVTRVLRIEKANKRFQLVHGSIPSISLLIGFCSRSFTLGVPRHCGQVASTCARVATYERHTGEARDAVSNAAAVSSL